MIELEAAARADASLEEAVEALSGRSIAFLTGAGVSTDSGIPDYRGEGAPRRTPMTVSDFLSSEERRRRYWAGSQLGWARFDAAEPNGGHRAIAAFEEAGMSPGVVTQNVDGLHLRAGSRRVVALHGTMDTVTCLACGQSFARSDVAARLDELNPWLSGAEDVVVNPDGDAEPARVDEVRVPACTVCGGVLKPDVVFFGEFVPTSRFRRATEIVQTAEALVVAGSSLVVNSGIRIVEIARRARKPIVIVNRGETKGDSRATVKIDAGTTATLEALASRLIAR